MSWPWLYLCADCSIELEIDTERSACDCGGLLDLKRNTSTPSANFGTSFAVPGYRYGDHLPCRLEDLERVSLGADMVTPLLSDGDEYGTWLKCDQLLPTGSFKDRGATILVALAIQHGAQRIVVDSSGNAGAAIAAHAARAGIDCEIFVPDTTPEAKIRQIRAMGSSVRLVSGSRDKAEVAAMEEARTTRSFYASHALNPHFHHGVKTWSFEVFDQLGEEPGTVVVPVGNGSLLLGVVLGFRELLEQGLIRKLPRIIAVQTKAHSTLAFKDTRTFEGKALSQSLAEGVSVPDPARRRQIHRALVDTNGLVAVVSDTAILDAQRELGNRGFYVESTGALAWAGYRALQQVEQLTIPVVIALTGSGFKTQNDQAI